MHLVTTDMTPVSQCGRAHELNLPGNTATFLTGIDLPTWHRYPLESAGLVYSHREEKSAR
jgi:hypothetical protein